MPFLLRKTASVVEMGEIQSGRRAVIMGIGTAVPPKVLQQSSFPDYYFEITNSNHMVDLKAKFTKLCENTKIEKRHVYMTDEFVRNNPSLTAYKSPSLNLRQELADATVPQLGAEAARNAIADWGRQVSDLTHLVFCTMVSGSMPAGADFELVKLLGLPLSTRRFMMYQAGCHGGGISLRLAKDLAENNPGARVLIVCSEVTAMAFRGPSESHLGNLVGQAIFGDAAGAVVVGADLVGQERAMFEMVSASQHLVPGTEEMVVSKLHEDGMVFTLHPGVAHHVSSNVGALVKKALEHAGLAKDWNKELFWLVHPGGREILDRVEKRLGLREEKMEVMRQRGNTLSSSVIAVMDEMRRRSEERTWAADGGRRA